MDKISVKIKCDKFIKELNEVCNYEWNYKGKGLYALCPRCRQAIKVSTHILEEKNNAI